MYESLQGQENKTTEHDQSHTNGSLPKPALTQQSSQGKLSGPKSLSAQAPKFSPGSSQSSMVPESNGNSEEIVVHG